MRFICLTFLLTVVGCEREPIAERKPSVSAQKITADVAVTDRNPQKASTNVQAINRQETKRRPALATLTSVGFAEEVEAVSHCPITEPFNLKQCSAYKRVWAILADKGDSSHRRFLMTSVGKRLIGNQSLQVRWLAIRLLRSIAQVEPSTRALLIERLDTETEPPVLTLLLQTLGLFVPDDEALRQRYRTFATHTSSQVRGAAITWLSPVDVEQQGKLTPKLFELLRSDGSKAVSTALCSLLARDLNLAKLAQLKSVIVDDGHPASSICFVALTDTWVSPSVPVQNVLGFDLTIGEIHRRVDQKTAISWTVVSRIAQGRHLIQRQIFSDEQIQKLREVLLRIVHAQDQDVQVRVASVQALGTYGASKQIFEQIIARYENETDVQFQLAARAKTYLPAPENP